MSKKYVQPYLFFGGRCEEAIAFYKDTLGATIGMIMHYKENPEALSSGKLAPGFENKVMHASFKIGDTNIMASDGCDFGTKFEGFSLSVALPNENDVKRAFQALSKGGKITMPLEKTFWSPCFGMLTDQFGIGWMVTVAE
jgi:PhnB protein